MIKIDIFVNGGHTFERKIFNKDIICCNRYISAYKSIVKYAEDSRYDTCSLRNDLS